MIRFSDLPLSGMRFFCLPRLACIVVVAAFLSILGACNKFELRGQSLAQVNGKSITEYQLGNELKRMPDAGAMDSDRGKALQELIDRELLQAEAVRARIDHDPHVAAALENARAQILAQAYLQSRVAFVQAPSPAEVRAYFDKYPERFVRRKLFHMKEIILPSSEVTPELKAAMDAAKSLEDVAAWLDGRRIPYAQEKLVQSTTDLPESLLAKMLNMQVGQMFIALDGSSATLAAIADIQDSPLAYEAAAPQIKRMLLDQRGRGLGESELARLRASARVKYADKAVSRFASSPKSATPVGSERIVKVSGAQRDAAQ